MSRSTSEDGLVQLPELGRFKRVLGVAACVLTFAALLATSSIDLIAPVPRRKVYGLEAKESVPSGNWLTGDAARRVEAQIDDHSRVRRRTHSLYSIALHQFLREGGERVVVGKSGTLFLKDRLVLSGQSERQAVTNTTLLAATISRRFEAHGIPFLFLPIPRKAVLDAEYLPDSVDALPHFDALIIRSLQEMGVDTVDLIAQFSEDLPERLHYFPQDSHWNFETRIDAFHAVGRRLRPEGIEHPSTLLSRPFPHKDPRDIQRYLGALSEDLVKFTGEPESMFRRVEAHPAPTGPALPPKSLWLFGSSFTALPYLPDLIAHCSAYEAKVWSQAGRDALSVVIDQFNRDDFGEVLPDACVYEYPIHVALGTGHYGYQYAQLTKLPEAGGDLRLDMPHVLKRRPHALVQSPKPATVRPLGWIEPARILRQANGAVLLRLRAREAPKVASRIRLDLPTRTLLADWPEGRRTCDIPLPAENAGDDRINLSLRSPYGDALDLVLESMDLILDAEDQPFQVAKVLPLKAARESAGPTWKQQLEFDPPLRTRMEKLEILFEVRTGKNSKRPFAVRGVALDGTPTDWIPFGGVHRLGYVTFPSSMLEGLDLSRLEIMGGGKPPAQFVVRAGAYRAAPALTQSNRRTEPR